MSCYLGIIAAVLVPLKAMQAAEQLIHVAAYGFRHGDHSSIRDSDDHISLTLDADPSGALAVPFNQSAVKQSTAPTRFGPDPRNPYFKVRFALPVPPDNATNVSGNLTGLDANVWAHNHSPGLEVLPNGDVLAIYFSATTSSGASESDAGTRFVQARLRHGAEQWDPPELFLDFKEMNDQSALLWAEGNKTWFFGGGRGASDLMPFKLAVSTNNGMTWTLSLPQLDHPTTDYTAQPIANAFRGGDQAMYLAMDAAKNASFLWRSADGGVHWNDTGGRTGARHSAIIPLDDNGRLLSIGGKNVSLGGWSPENLSLDWGKSWSSNQPSLFPALGGNQRPSVIRLANGHLLYVADSYRRGTPKSPEGWKLGDGCFVAVSKDNGLTWHFKQLPVTLPHEKDHALGTLGYATARQGPNGVIHVLATMTHPCLHYEFNEAWIYSDAGDLPLESERGKLQRFREDYPDGTPRIIWSARICESGRYLLDGQETSFYSNGSKEHQVSYRNGLKTGQETFWTPSGCKLWTWKHDLKRYTSTWTHYWPNGRKKVESKWNTRAKAGAPERTFIGLEADGPAQQWSEQGRLQVTHHFVHGRLKPENHR